MSDERDDTERAEPWRWMMAADTRSMGNWLALVTLVMAVGLAMFERTSSPPVCPQPDDAAQAPATPDDLDEPNEPNEPGTRLTAVRVWPDSDEQRAELMALAHDVWSEHPGMPLDLVLDGAGLETLRRRSIEFTELVADIAAVADAERRRLGEAQAARPTPDQWFSEYRDLETIHGYLEQLARLRPDLAQLSTVGTSLEGRPLRALRIHGTGDARRRMLINGGLHAREWISMMVTTCVADRLLRGYEDDPARRRFVDEVELWVLPVSNPDGYVHSWRHDRYWRKNRRGEHGVDLNRNFGFAWGGDGSSDNPASQVYRGTAPFSEPEAAAIRALMDAERFDAHIDFHSYGQLLLHPWSHTRDRARDHRRLQRLAKGMASAIKAEHGERYRLISGASLYPASGTLMDWAYGAHGAASFVIELRPRGGSGFVLPPDQIEPTCDEGLAAVLSLHQRARIDGVDGESI